MAGVQNGYLPSMLRHIVLHEVLWWMVYGGKPQDLNTAALQSCVSYSIVYVS